MSEVTFDLYMSTVNRILTNTVHLDANDLADVDYYGMYEGGTSPADAAKEALYASGATDDLVNHIAS